MESSSSSSNPPPPFLLLNGGNPSLSESEEEIDRHYPFNGPLGGVVPVSQNNSPGAGRKPIFSYVRYDEPVGLANEDLIIPGLFLGSYHSFNNYKLYDFIVNADYPYNGVVRYDVNHIFVSLLPTEVPSLGVPRVGVPRPEEAKTQLVLALGLADVPDSDISELIPEVNTHIDYYLRNGKKVLVHCHMGISRSVALVIGYLMWKLKVPLQTAYNIVVAKRNIINPNYGFINQLIEYEADLRLSGHLQ